MNANSPPPPPLRRRWFLTARERAGLSALAGALIAVAVVALAWLATTAAAAELPAHTVVACQSPDEVTLADLLAQAAWTAEVGKGEASSARRTVKVAIALPALHTSAAGAWACLTWNAELVLSGAETGATGPSVRLAAGVTAVQGRLDSDEAAYWRVHLEPQPDGRHFVERAWLRVWLRNPSAPIGEHLRQANGSPFWLFPVAIHL